MAEERLGIDTQQERKHFREPLAGEESHPGGQRTGLKTGHYNEKEGRSMLRPYKGTGKTASV
jgi:hypothetical protein